MKGKLKKILSKKIFYVTLALILVGVVEIVYASNLINSKNVSYSNSSSKLTSTNVQGAIDELYNSCKEVKEECPDGQKCSKKITSNNLLDNIVTNGDGLYQDSVETNKYFYRGKNPNNYIVFSGDMYRILNINSDGTMRIKMNKTLVNYTYDVNGRSSDYCTSTKYGCNVWGSKTTTRDSNGNIITKMPRDVNSSSTYTLPSQESDVNEYLNGSWYPSITQKEYIKTNSTFNVGGVKYLTSTFQSLATDVNYEEKYTWQGNIGLMEVTDYPRTNSNQSSCGSVTSNNNDHNYATCKNTSWIYEDGDVYPWFITPAYDDEGSYTWHLRPSGAVQASYDYVVRDVMPVLTLKSNLQLIGNGSIDNPYQIIN